MRLIYPRNKGVFFSVVLVLLVILIILTKMAFSPADNSPVGNISPNPKIVNSPTKISGKNCGELKGDVTACENTVRLALIEYPGKVFLIEEVKNTFRTGNQTFLIVSIDLEKELQIEGKGTMTKIKTLVSEDGAVMLYGGSL